MFQTQEAGSPEESVASPEGRLGTRVWILGFVMVALGAVTAFLLFRGYRSDSYLYLFFYCIPSNTAITVFPHEPVLIQFGKFADPWLAALAATGGTLVAGGMDHSVFVPVLNHRAVRGYRGTRLYRRAVGFFGRLPFATLTAAALLPVPFFPFKFLSFSVGYPLPRYLAALAVGRYPRYLLLAWIGAVVPIPTPVLVGFFLLVLTVYGWKGGRKLVERRRSGGA